jgi:hypothetical protein
VPHFDAQELRQYIHPVMAAFSKPAKRSSWSSIADRNRAQLDATLERYHDKFRSIYPLIVAITSTLSKASGV